MASRLRELILLLYSAMVRSPLSILCLAPESSAEERQGTDVLQSSCLQAISFLFQKNFILSAQRRKRSDYVSVHHSGVTTWARPGRQTSWCWATYLHVLHISSREKGSFRPHLVWFHGLTFCSHVEHTKWTPRELSEVQLYPMGNQTKFPELTLLCAPKQNKQRALKEHFERVLLTQVKH